jgi:hypothetical protein
MHARGPVVLAAAVALAGLTAMPALAQECNHFHPPTPIEVGEPYYPECVAIGDLDGDGDGDLAITHYDVSGRLTLKFNAGDGTFPDQADYTAGDTPEYVAIGELDGQEGLDMVVVNYWSDYASIFLNDGTGVFTQSTITTNYFAVYVAIGDLDGDGDEDLAIAHWDDNISAVHYNNGDGSFTPGPTYPPTEGANTPASVAIGDLDGLNGNDIVVGTWYPWTFDQFLNNGDGTFTGEQIGTGGSCNISITVTDVDNDGDNDVGSALYWTDAAFTVSLNNGDATYQTSAYGTAAYAATDIAFADLDGQPGLEAIVLNLALIGGIPPGVVTVLTNDGMGGFSDRCNYEVGEDPWGLAVGDLNGDSWNDVVTANQLSGNCSLLLNRGSYCPGDIDGDGDTDHSDLGALLAAWCSVEGDSNWNPNADLDGDGHVGHGDLGILLADWGCGT